MDKLMESIGKILKEIFSPKTLWLIVVAVAILSLAILSIASSKFGGFFGIDKEFLGETFKGLTYKSWIGLVALASIALILAKVVTWIAQMKELVEILSKIIQSVLTAETFWLIVVALAILGVVIRVTPGSTLQGIGLVAFGAMALILAKVVVWVVGLLRDQFFA